MGDAPKRIGLTGRSPKMLGFPGANTIKLFFLPGGPPPPPPRPPASIFRDRTGERAKVALLTGLSALFFVRRGHPRAPREEGHRSARRRRKEEGRRKMGLYRGAKPYNT